MSNIVVYNKEGGYTGFLGNVLFQTAATIGIAVKNHMEYCFPPKDYYKAFVGPIPQRGLTELPVIDYNELNFHYDEVSFYPMPDSCNRNLKGYYQSGKYWKHCEDLIRSTFDFTEDIIKYIAYKYVSNMQPSKICISIHVRRGDYLNSPEHHPTLGVIYYQKASEIMEDILGLPKDALHYVVFSDDMNWCKDNLLKTLTGRVTFAEGNSQEQDLYFMSICQHNIIANSSFSWWGSYLNANPDKTIIAPTKDKWFGPAYKDWNVNDLYLPSWILV